MHSLHASASVAPSRAVAAFRSKLQHIQLELELEAAAHTKPAVRNWLRHHGEAAGRVVVAVIENLAAETWWPPAAASGPFATEVDRWVAAHVRPAPRAWLGSDALTRAFVADMRARGIATPPGPIRTPHLLAQAIGRRWGIGKSNDCRTAHGTVRGFRGLELAPPSALPPAGAVGAGGEGAQTGEDTP